MFKLWVYIEKIHVFFTKFREKNAYEIKLRNTFSHNNWIESQFSHSFKVIVKCNIKKTKHLAQNV